MIRFIDVYKEYDNGTKALKRGQICALTTGKFVFLVGPSGSGKSTIIKADHRRDALTQGKTHGQTEYSMSNISPKAGAADAPHPGHHFPGFPAD